MVCLILCIHSSIDGHVGYFHLLTFISNAAMNIPVPILFQYLFLILPCIYLGLEQQLHHFTLPPAMYESFNFFTSFPEILIFH